MNIKTRRYFFFIALMVMLTAFMPLASAHLPKVIRSYHLWVFLWGLSILVFAPKVLARKLMIIIGLYGCFLLIMLNTVWHTMDEWNIMTLWTDYYSMVVAASIISYFDYTSDYTGLAKLTKYTLLFILITAVLTIFTSFIEPMYSRMISYSDQMSRLSNTQIEEISRLQRYGGGDRGDGFGFMALLPLVIYYYKNNQLISMSKTLMLLFVALCIIASIRMQFTALIFFTIIFSSLALVTPKNRQKLIIIFSLLAIAFFLTPTYIFVSFLDNLSNTLSGLEDLSTKLKDLAQYIEFGGGEIQGNIVSGRIDTRYSAFLDYFRDNPILGFYFLNDSAFGEIGIGHLFLMNKLTVMGIIGFLFWAFIFFRHYKMQANKVNQEYKYFFLLSLLAIMLYGLVKVIVVRQAWLLFFVIIPGMYYLPLINKKLRSTFIT